MEYNDILDVQINDMENVEIAPSLAVTKHDIDHSPFIEANTEQSSLEEIRKNHIIPVFVKENEPLISHAEFIESVAEVVSSVYHGEHILKPDVRLSHPIKGRIPDAKDKPAKDLQEFEKTLYFERLAFVIQIPSIKGDVAGNPMSLTIGGVKSYGEDNLYSKKGTEQHFKIFVGFKNSVCTNLCVWTDGYRNDLKVRSVGELKGCVRTMIENYNSSYHLFNLQQLNKFSLTENQFSYLIGRCRMFHYLPLADKKGITPLSYGDQQLNAVVKDYYKDKNFRRNDDGSIDLWKLYNLFTGTNKSSYIDSFLDRSVNAYSFIEQIRFCIEGKDWSWFISPSL